MPEISGKEGEAVIIAWHVNEKDSVARDQDLLEVSTDKATFDVSVPCDGTLVKILKKEGDTVLKNEVIGIIETSDLSVH